MLKREYAVQPLNIEIDGALTNATAIVAFLLLFTLVSIKQLVKVVPALSGALKLLLLFRQPNIFVELYLKVVRGRTRFYLPTNIV